MIWFEDATIGSGMTLGSHCFEAEEIADFARRHVPEAEALAGRRAAGWHVVAIWMQLMIGQRRDAPPIKAGERAPILGPSPGFLSLGWPHAVQAGEVITYRTRVTEKIELKSRPQWGIVRNLNEAHNVRGECVMRFTGQALFERRHPGGIS